MIFWLLTGIWFETWRRESCSNPIELRKKTKRPAKNSRAVSLVVIVIWVSLRDVPLAWVETSVLIADEPETASAVAASAQIAALALHTV